MQTSAIPRGSRHHAAISTAAVQLKTTAACAVWPRSISEVPATAKEPAPTAIATICRSAWPCSPGEQATAAAAAAPAAGRSPDHPRAVGASSASAT